MTPPDRADPSVAALLTIVGGRKRRGLQRLSATIGPAAARRKHIRTQLFLTHGENDGLKAMGLTLAQHLGRPVAQALTVRLALQRLAVEMERSLTDPAVADRLTSDLLRVRSEQTDPAPITPNDTPAT